MKNNLKVTSKRAAMEMSVGTIVTIVLLMTVLVLGLVLIKSIFDTGTTAIDSIDDAVQGQIQKLFAEEGKKLVVYPVSKQITIEKKDKKPSGFAFSVKNLDTDSQDFTYSIEVDNNFDTSKCGSSFTTEKGNSWLLIDSGSFTLGGGDPMDSPALALLDIPETAPPCTIPYKLTITDYAQTTIFITIE